MAITSATLFKIIFVFFILVTLLTPQAVADCEAQSANACNNKKKALPLKLIAVFAILVCSIIGVTLPLVTRSIPALNPENDLFVIVKCFAAGIILGTGFMHVLPDSFDMLRSDCLKEKLWHEFPFSGFVAMFSAIITMMVDSLATSAYTKKIRTEIISSESNPAGGGDQEMGGVVNFGHHHPDNKTEGQSQLLRSCKTENSRLKLATLQTGLMALVLCRNVAKGRREGSASTLSFNAAAQVSASKAHGRIQPTPAEAYSSISQIRHASHLATPTPPPIVTQYDPSNPRPVGIATGLISLCHQTRSHSATGRDLASPPRSN
ncbi:Fe(2+) transport protein [Vigna angularis]|uniref:Fe(2+) transport protein n=1 Tax=Phaseolus angularis TaxID=3914 RepID=A0A8T0LGC3_PHAAN|nr:Fe(2+) transport protein [Vigna angularis]